MQHDFFKKKKKKKTVYTWSKVMAKLKTNMVSKKKKKETSATGSNYFTILL